MIPLAANAMLGWDPLHQTLTNQWPLYISQSPALASEWGALLDRLATFVQATQALADVVDRIDDVAMPDGHAARRFRVELSSDLLDEQGTCLDMLIGLVFDTLGAPVLEVRVVPTNPPQPRP